MKAFEFVCAVTRPSLPSLFFLLPLFLLLSHPSSSPSLPASNSLEPAPPAPSPGVMVAGDTTSLAPALQTRSSRFLFFRSAQSNSRILLVEGEEEGVGVVGGEAEW